MARDSKAPSLNQIVEQDSLPAPHVHKWKTIQQEYVPNPSWWFGQTRYPFKRCCGARQLRLTLQITVQCSICESTLVTTNGDQWGYCDICGGLYDHTSRGDIGDMM